jgi:thioredoxin reductase (NADPH)
MALDNRSDRMFPRLDEDDFQQLSPMATCQTFAAGEKILRFGQADIDLIVIESGSIDILNPMNENKLVVRHGPGEFVGDIDLLTRRPIIIDAVSHGDDNGGPTRILRVPGGDCLRKLLNTVPRLGEKLIVAIQVRRQELDRAGSMGIRVIGPGGCSDTNRVREFLYKNFVPFHWTDSATDDGRHALAEMGTTPVHGNMPAVDCGAGKVLFCPSLPDLAKCAGVWRGCPSQDVDLAIVGAGPAGIAAAVYAASEGLKTVVLDKLGPGGQAGGSSKIENFIGFPAGLSGTDLSTRGVLQMLKFGAQMIAPVTVKKLEPAADENSPHLLHLDCGTVLRAHTVLATTGVRWRRLAAEGAQRFERAGVYYACTTVESRLHEHCDVAVVGGGNSAGQAVMFLADQDRHRTVHHLVRRELGPGMSEYLVRRIRGSPNVKVHENTEVVAVSGTRRLESLNLINRQTERGETLACNAVFVFIGAEPHSDWLPDTILRDGQKYILSGTDVAKSGKWPLKDRDPCPLETSLPRVLVGGDLRSGSTKRVGFAVGDGSLAVTCAHRLRAIHN